MILAVDVGNSETTIGLFDSRGNLQHHFRYETKHSETGDEIAVDLNGLLNLVGYSLNGIEGVVLSSVVPPVTTAFVAMAKKYLPDKLFINLEPGVKTGLPILYENPKEIGADRIANAVGCISRYGSPAVVVDFGTATTFDVISAEGEYLGGLIYPGIMTSAQALFERAARLSQVEIKKPGRFIGRNTVESIQSGLVFGTAAMTDELIRRIRKEIGKNAVAVATGGLARLLRGVSKEIDHFDPELTLYGLFQIFTLNAG
jgi:type III pantothenate kinase